MLSVKEYEPIYKASVAVAQHPAPQINRSTSRRKRESDDDEEETARYSVLVSPDFGFTSLNFCTLHPRCRSDKRQAVDDDQEDGNDPDAMEL